MNETTLMVLPIDKDKMLEYISRTPPFAFRGDHESYVIDVGALVGTNVIVDEECCYRFLESRFHDGKVQLVYDIPVRIKTKTETGESFSMMVDFYFPISAEKLTPFLKKEQDLKTFMGQRYNYNPRIENNMKGFLKDVGYQLETETE